MENATEHRQPNDEVEKPKSKSWFAERFGSADAWTAGATIFLVLVGIWGVWETKRSLRLSERAWISPVTMALQAPLEEGKAIRYNLLMLNFGKEPGLNVAHHVKNAIVKAPPPEDWSGLQVGENHTCEGLRPIKGAQAIFPSINGTFTFRGFDSSAGDDPVLANKAIIDGVLHYYVRGCLAYETFEETHTAAYCFVLQSRPNVPFNQLLFLSCPTGFEAN